MKILEVLHNSQNLSLHDFEGSNLEYKSLLKWHTDENVLEFYHGRDKVFVMEKLKKTYTKMQETPDVYPSIIKLNDELIGYLQYYKLQKEGEYSSKEYQVEYSEDTYGIDLFIGEIKYWGKGIGTLLLKKLCVYLISQLDAKTIYIDPKIDNKRAIKAYQNAGFKKVRIMKDHEVFEGKNCDSWLMTYSC